MRRPLFAVAISMIAGIFYSDCFGLWLSLVMALASAAILFYMGKNIIIKPEIFRSSIMITAAFLAGAMMVSVAGWGMDNSPLNSMTGKSVRYQATVSRIEKVDDEKYRLTCDVKTADDEKSNGKLLITYYRALKDTTELWGRTISFTSSIEVPLSAGNPRCFDYQKFLRSKSIGFTGNISAFWIDDSYSSNVIENLKGTAVRFIVRRRDGFTASLGGSEWTRAFAEGVLFGEKSEMDDEIYQDFKNNGTAHVLAVSGLHVGMLFGMYRKLTKKRRGKLQIAAFAAILMVYGTATLWAVPVTRAILLIVIMTDLGALTLNTFRFLGAFLVVGVISYAKIRKVSRTTLKNAFYIGTSLVFVYIGATFGVKYTELSNVGFLCGLSVVFTPFMERFTFKRKIQKRVYIAAFMSVVGIMLLTLKSDFSINMDNIKGDLLCIMCAFAYSIEVILTEKAVDKEDVDPFHLGVFQLGVTGAYMLVLSFIFEHPHFPSTPSIWAGVIFLSLVCTGLAFIVQTIAQQYTSSSHGQRSFNWN